MTDKQLMLLNCGAGEDSSESLGCKEIKPASPKGNQSWMLIGMTDAEAEALILWPRDAKNWLLGKDLMLGKTEGRKRRGMTEDEMVGWHHHSMDTSLRKLTFLSFREAWRTAVHVVPKSWTWLSDWTELRMMIKEQNVKSDWNFWCGSH